MAAFRGRDGAAAGETRLFPSARAAGSHNWPECCFQLPELLEVQECCAEGTRSRGSKLGLKCNARPMQGDSVQQVWLVFSPGGVRERPAQYSSHAG